MRRRSNKSSVSSLRCRMWWLGRLNYAELWHEELEDEERHEINTGGKDKDRHRVEGKVMGDEPGEACSTGRSGGTSDAHDSGDRSGGEHVGGGGEEVGGPALVGGSGETEESDGRPGVAGKERVHVGYEHNRRNAYGADEEGKLAA